MEGSENFGLLVNFNLMENIEIFNLFGLCAFWDIVVLQPYQRITNFMEHFMLKKFIEICRKK